MPTHLVIGSLQWSKNKVGERRAASRARSSQSRTNRREFQSNDYESTNMVYESDFYTYRRPYRPTSTYSVTTPRHYVVVDREPLPRRAEEQYSYSYSSTTQRSNGSGLPQRSTYSNTVERRTGSGPGGYSYSSERSSNLGGPGGYSYSSSTSGRLPYGTSYRHYSYRV